MASSIPKQSTSSTPRPIILVTGANAGLGFATCQRLLLQLSSPTPSDTLPFCPDLRPAGEGPVATPFTAPHGCTLIMACRNPIKAHKARRALVGLVERLKHLPDHIESPTSAALVDKYSVGPRVSGKATVLQQEPDEVIAQTQEEDAAQMNTEAHVSKSAANIRNVRGLRKRANAGKDEDKEEEIEEEEEEDSTPLLQDDIQAREAKARGKYRRRFCRGTKIEFVALDLGSMASVLNCAKQVQERYPYLTHLIHNAGGAAFTGLNWFKAVFMIMTSFHTAMTWPSFKMQRSGDISQDGLGWVWQTNVGSSWALSQALLPHMRKSPYSTPSRIIFTSSIEAVEHYYNADDYQCLEKDEKICKPYESTKYQCELAAHGLSRLLKEEDEAAKNPQVYLTHPGVVATSIMAEFLNAAMSLCMLAAFYVARWTLSPYHCIEPYKGSIAHVHTSLAPSTSLSSRVLYNSRCNFWGQEYVQSGRTNGWDDLDEQGSLQGHVAQLATDWTKKTVSVTKKIRRDSDAGILPPNGGLIRQIRKEDEENGSRRQSIDVVDEDSNSSKEWEKVDQAV
ncbi:unnamed protein product [Sympodiomycopsis kandeliae]